MKERDFSVVEIIDESARKFADHIVLSEIAECRLGTLTSARDVSYGELHTYSRCLANGLYGAGLKRGARVAVLLENSVELVVTEWACLLSGLVWVALNVRMSASDLQRVLDDCAPAAVIYGPRLHDLAAAVLLPARTLRILAAPTGADWSRMVLGERAAPTASVASEPPGPAEPVRIRYTSGTAGTPKGAVLARRCYDASVAAVTDVVGPIRPEDVLVQVAPMTHASGALLLPHARVGARCVILRHFDARALIDVVDEAGATCVFLVPTMLVRLIEALDDPSRLASLRTIVYGGASMPVDRLRRGLDVLGPIFVQIYGLTESTWPVCALSREDHVRRGEESEQAWLRRLRSCGRATAVGSVRVVGADGRDVPSGQSGELWVRGRNTMTGYWRLANHPGIEDRRGLDAEGWMHTGDVGFVDEEGFITIVDRLDDMIISGGFNIYPCEVENALSQHAAVLEAAVVGRPDPEWGETVHAAVVLRPGCRVTAEDLSQHCARILAGYKKPRSIEILDDLPRNSSGKVLRRRIRANLLP